MKCRPGDTEDSYNSKTYIRDMKSRKDRVLTKHESSISAFCFTELWTYSMQTLNSRRITKREKQGFPFDFGRRTCFSLCSTALWTLSFRTKKINTWTWPDSCVSMNIWITLFYDFIKCLFNACIINKLLFSALFTCSPLYCLTGGLTLGRLCWRNVFISTKLSPWAQHVRAICLLQLSDIFM